MFNVFRWDRRQSHRVLPVRHADGRAAGPGQADGQAGTRPPDRAGRDSGGARGPAAVYLPQSKL